MKRRSRTSRLHRRSPEAVAFARAQRAQANEFARAMWQLLRARRCRGHKFRREYPIPPYTVDFCCVDLKLFVEVDGKDHLTPDGRKHDQQRDEFLAELGYQVVRIEGYQLLRDPLVARRHVEAAIDARISEPRPLTPSPSPPNKFGGEGSQDQ